MKKSLIIGPPGTGKTSYVAAAARRAVEKYGPEGVFISSLTKAAAAEAAGRNLPIPDEQIGTLHALCYRSFERKTITTTKKELLAEFQRRHGYQVSKGDGDDNDSIFEAEGSGDHLNRYSLLRNQMIPRSSWSHSLLTFAAKWEAFKEETGTVDFTDLIERALAETEGPPGGCDVLFIDESQDLSPLLFQLVEHWGRSCEHLMMVGDPDQNLYSWAGSDAENIRPSKHPDAFKKVLDQSYRVPKAVHAEAQRMIRRIGPRRDDVTYHPTAEEGQVDRMELGVRVCAEDVVDQAVRAESDGTVMILATCKYMLRPLVAVLRQRGIPFWNPYRKKEGQWNPLASIKRGKGRSNAERVETFTRGGIGKWTARDVQLWTEPLRVKGIMVRGAKQHLARFCEDSPGHVLTPVEYGIFEPEARAALEKPNPRWLIERVKAPAVKPMQYAAAVLKSRGSHALREEPKIIVSTIHGCKGGEADTVFLSPELSSIARMAVTETQAAADAVYRQIYVGMTRARKRLVLCGEEAMI